MPLGWAHYFMLAQFLLLGLVVLVPFRIALGTIGIMVISQTSYVRSITNAEPQFFFPDIVVSVPIIFLALVVVVTMGLKQQRQAENPRRSIVPAE